MKKLIKYIAFLLLVLLLVVEIIKVIRMFDLSEIINISHDAWLDFFGTLLGIFVTVIGFIFTIYEFINEKEERERPLVIIKPAYEKDCYYRCDNIQNNYTQHKKVYFELINKGDTIIKNPQIKNDEGKILNIYKLEGENELDIIEPQNFQTNNKYVISIDINFLEGMCAFIVNNFELEYKNYNNKKYNCKFEIEINKYSDQDIKVFMKE